MNRPLNTVVIDHSDTQRHLIAHLVKKHRKLNLKAEVFKLEQIHELFEDKVTDLVILDIDFPGLNSFDFVASLGAGIQVVLATSNPGYALQAFELGVTDYLLKPIGPVRFNEAITKAFRRFQHHLRSVEPPEYLEIRSEHEYQNIPLHDIRWIEALGDYVKIVTRKDRFLVLSSLTSIEAQLPKSRFLRIHRSYIVNLDKVKNFSCTDVEVEGRHLPLSRQRKTTLEEILLSTD